MFTINGIKNLGKTRVLWENIAPAASPAARVTTQESPDDLIRNAKTAHEKGDKKAFEENLAKLTKINDQTKDKLLSQIDSQMDSDDDRSGVLVAFYNAVKGDYDRIADIYKKDGQGVIVDTRANTFAISETIKGINTRSEQAESFLKMLQEDKTLSGFAEKFGFAKPQGGEDPTNKSNNTFGQVFLEHNSLAGIANHVLYGVPYTTDGTFGPNEKPSIANFITEYNKLKDSQKKSVNNLLRQVSLANLSGLTSIEAASVSTMKPDQSYYSYLIEGSNSYKSETAKGLPTLLKTILGNISEKDMPKALIRALKIGGYEGDIPKDEASLKNLLSADAGAKLAIIAGITHVARHGGAEHALTSDTIVTLDSGYRAFLDHLNTPEGKAEFKNGLTSAIDTNTAKLIKEIEADTAKNPGNKGNNDKKIEAIKAYQNSMKNDPSFFNLHFQGYSAYITNVSAGVGVSWGGRLDTFVADTVSLGVGLDSASKQPIVGLTFAKEITNNTQFLYGISTGGAYIGGAHHFDAGYNISGMLNKFGGSVTLSKDMQKNQQILDATAGIQTEKDILTSITNIAGNTSKKVKDIDFKGTVPPGLITENAQNSLNQDSYAAINTQISKSIRTYLGESSFDKETNPLIREQMIKEAMRRAIQDRVDAVNFDVSSGGWSLSQIGVTLGVFAGAKFILPYISFERKDISVNIVRTETQRKEIRKESFAVTDLFETPKFKDNSNEYYLPLKEKSALAGISTTLPPGAMWDIDRSGNAIGISGLKDKAITIVKKPDKTYAIEYNTQDVVNTKKSVQDKAAVTSNTDLSEGLTRHEGLRKNLADRSVRIALSNLLINPDRKNNANAFANALQYSPDDAKAALIKVLTTPRLLPDLKGIKNIVENATGQDLKSILYDIRGAMMMDMTQARTFSASTDSAFTVNESRAATKSRYEKMVNDNRFASVLPSGWTASDFTGIIPEGIEKSFEVKAPNPKRMGAFLSLKTETPYMAYMPAGTVRTTFEKEVTSSARPDQKNSIFESSLPVFSPEADTIMKTLGKTLGMNTVPTYAELETLVTTGKAKIGGREVNMTGQKFFLSCFSDCTNPGVSMELGSISAPATNRDAGVQSVPISGVEITETTTTSSRLSLDYQDHTVTGSMAAGLVKTPTETVKKPDTFETVITSKDVTITGPVQTPSGAMYNVTTGSTTVQVSFQNLISQYGQNARQAIIDIQAGRTPKPFSISVTTTNTVPGGFAAIEIPISPDFHASLMTKQFIDRVVADQSIGADIRASLQDLYYHYNPRAKFPQ